MNTSHRPVLVDSGNLLFKKADSIRAKSAGTLTAEAIASAYAAMEFDGVGIGIQDLAGGLKWLLKTREQGVPWLSANIYDNEDTRIFEAYRSVNYGNLKIAVVAITGAVVQTDEFSIKNADSELSKLLPELDLHFDIIVLLSSLSFQQTVDTVNRFKQVDIVVTADSSKGNLQPLHSSNAIILQTTSRGQYLGVLDAKWRDKPWMKNNSSETTRLKRQLKSISMQFNQIQSLPPEIRAEKISSLEEQRKQVRDKIQKLDHETTALNPLDFSSYRCSFVPLSAAVRKDPGIEQIVKSYKKRISEATQSKQKRPGS